jgi:hypothetical protein
MRPPLQANLLAAAGRDGVAFGGHWLGRADVSLDSDFLGHEKLRLKIGQPIILERFPSLKGVEERCGQAAVDGLS